ncbi:hypothetical protein FG386_002673 [Cryptosporidium ryanae]|uniref:uncharacterized protein n=1 Tax=Cryptosporidium ryanae TaxID=515981 RepID=UPI00351A19A7|nr:hypothetical protein FG386_002673 [Cryptosporidium ryanae]
MYKKGDLKYENINGEILKGEGLILSWNNWYFFPENTINLYIIKIKDVLSILSNTEYSNSNFFEYEIINSSVEYHKLPNTGSYSITVSDNISPDNYFIIVLKSGFYNLNFKRIVENGLITKPISVYKSPSINNRIVLLSLKDGRPFGHSDNIEIKYKLFSAFNEYNNNYNYTRKNNDNISYASVHIYAVDPDNIDKKEPIQIFKNIGDDLTISGLGDEFCTTYYTVKIKDLNYPLHSDKSNSYFWILPKNSYPLYLSIDEINSKNELCKRLNIKYGMFPNKYEFIILLIIIFINVLGFITLGIRINSYQRKIKSKKKNNS